MDTSSSTNNGNNNDGAQLSQSTLDSTQNVIEAYGAMESISREQLIRFISPLQDTIKKPQKTLLVTGKNSYRQCGAQAMIERLLPADTYIHFNQFSINPKLSDALVGARLAKEQQITTILAIGGGSVIDMAKLIKGIVNSIDDAEDIIRGHIVVVDNDIPLTVIPTTAGSGSESTHFAVAYIEKEKFSLAAPSLLPSHIILDGKLLTSASAYQKSVNGLDALAQAIEGYWSVNSTKASRARSLRAIEMLIKHLPSISNNEPVCLQAIMIAANLAGQVINTTKTTAAHAFSYAFTSYHNIPHGHAVWMTLPQIFSLHLHVSRTHATSNDTNSPQPYLNDPRGIEHLKYIMDTLSQHFSILKEKDATQKLQLFMRQLNVEPNMEKLGVNSKEQKQFIATQVNTQRLGNNPIALNETDINTIFGM